MSTSGEPGATLRRCTGLDRAAFAGQYWSQRPLLWHQPDGFLDLLSPADVDELVAERALRAPFFRMVKSGSSIAGITRAVAAGNRRTIDVADPDGVREQFAAGATLVLQSLHRFHPPLVRFCRSLAAELGHQVQCNAYVTPPGSQGFAPHHDTHDVFVLQLDGRKRWNVYEPVLQLPLSSQPSKDLAGDDGQLVASGASPLLSVELGPGDVLYLPRGYIHAAETGTDRSMHLTVGVLAATAHDVLRDVIALAAEEPAFRAALPLGSAQDQLEAVGGIVARAAAWLAALPAEQAQEAARRRVSLATAPAPLGMLATEQAARQLDKDTLVTPRPGIDVELVEDVDDRVTLVLPDRELSLPGFVAPALRGLLSGACRVGELDLPVDDALVLTRRLVREGVIGCIASRERDDE